MANQKVTNIYNLLSANGLTKAKDVNEFSNWMAGSNYRQNIYGLLKQAGVEGIGSGYGEFTALTGYGKKQPADATQRAQSIGQSVFGGGGQTDYLARQDNYTRPGALVEQLNQRDKEAEETITKPLRETAKKVQNRQFTPQKIQYVDENNKVVDEDEVYPVIPKEIAEDELNRMAYDRLQAVNNTDIDAQIAALDKETKDIFQNSVDNYKRGQKPKSLWGRMADVGTTSAMPSGTQEYMDMVNAVGNNPEYKNRVAALNLLKQASYVKRAAEQSKKTDVENKKGVGDWIDDTVGWFKDAGFGMKEAAKNVSTWDMGATTATDAKALYDAAQKFDNGEKLSESEQQLLNAAATYSAFENTYGKEVGSGVKAGQITMEALPFMAEMLVNPASGTGRALQKKFIGKGMTELVKNMVKSIAKKEGRMAAAKELAGGTLARVGGDLLGAAVMAGTTGAQSVAGDTYRRMQGQSQFGVDANGNIKYAGHEIHNYEWEPWTAFEHAFLARTIENQSEMVGAYFAPALGIGGKVLEKGLSKMKLGGVVNFIKSMGATKGAKLVDNFFEKTKWDGTIGEYAEEVVGGIENALVVGDQTLDQDPETGVFNGQQNLETFLSVALMGGFLSTFQTGVGALSYAKGKQQLNRADYLASEALGDEWSGIKQTIDHSTAENASANLSQILSDPNMSPEQKQAVREYAKRKESLRGVLYGEESRKKEKAQEKAATRPANIDVAADGQTVVQKNQNGEVIAEEKFDDEEEAKAHADILKMQRAEQDFQDDLATAIEASEQRRQAVENGTPDDFPLSEEMERYVRTQALNRIIPEGVEEGSPEYEAFVRNMDTPGTAENDILLEMMDSFDPLEDAYETVAVLEDSDRNEIDKAIKTDPVKRTERQQKLVSEIAWRLHMYNFPKGELHPEQSFADGQTQAELDGAGTMEADPEAMQQMKQSMDDAQQALDDAVAQNTDLAAYVNETINSNEPFAPEDVISGMIGRFSDDEIATVADYINAQSKLDGYLDYTNGKIQQYVERETSKRAFKGKLNGAPSGNMVMVTDGENQYFLVNGDVQVGENGEILSAGEANGIVVVDEEGNIMPMGLDSSLRVEMGATLEEYAASLLQQQQVNTTAQMGFEAPEENGNNESDESNGAETETPPLTPPEGEETAEEEVEGQKVTAESIIERMNAAKDIVEMDNVYQEGLDAGIPEEELMPTYEKRLQAFADEEENADVSENEWTYYAEYDKGSGKITIKRKNGKGSEEVVTSSTDSAGLRYYLKKNGYEELLNNPQINNTLEDAEKDRERVDARKERIKERQIKRAEEQLDFHAGDTIEDNKGERYTVVGYEWSSFIDETNDMFGHDDVTGAPVIVYTDSNGDTIRQSAGDTLKSMMRSRMYKKVEEAEQDETVSDEKISEIDAALAKIPTRSSEKDGEPDYIWEDAPAEDTIDALAAINDGNMDAVSETATMMRKEAESELKKAEKLKTSGKNPIEMAKSRAENRQKAEEAQKRLDYWKAVEEQVKGLIKQAEEAPLRQAEEEDASTRTAIIEEKSDNDAKWKTLHQLYDGTIADDGEILDESRPMDINELVAMNMPRNIAWESYTVDGTHVKRGLQDELGSHHTRGIGKNVGTNAFNTFLAKKGTGISIDEAIHQIWESGENEIANGEKRFSDQEIRNAVIDMFLSAEKPSDITNYVVNNRSRLANEKLRQEEEYMREQEANAYADAEAQARGFADADEESDYNEFIAEEIKLQAEYEQRTEEGTAEQMPPVAESAEGGEQGEGGTAESTGTEREVPLSEPGETETEGNTESGTGDNATDGGVYLEGGEYEAGLQFRTRKGGRAEIGDIIDNGGQPVYRIYYYAENGAVGGDVPMTADELRAQIENGALTPVSEEDAATESQPTVETPSGEPEGTVANINPNYKPKPRKQLLEEKKAQLEETIERATETLNDNDPMERVNHDWARGTIQAAQEELDKVNKELGEAATESQPTVKNPSGNKLVSDERYEELKKRMRDKLLGQMNIGVDPEILALGVEMAVYHIEKGARKFAEYAKAMIEDMGDVIRPYLKAFYNGARDLPEMEELSKEMDDYGTVQSFDVANFDKQTPDPMAQAQQIRDEKKVEKDAETAKESLNYDKQDTGTVNVNKKENKKKKKSVSLQEIDLFGDSAEYSEREDKRDNLIEKVRSEMASRVAQNASPLTMNEVKKMAAAEGLEMKDTDLQELVETAAVMNARAVASVGFMHDKTRYDRIVKYYQMQPLLNKRDSDRVEKQQYSTPTPFAYLMGMFMKAGKDIKSVLEPSAGNGALTICFPKDICHVNDIDHERLVNLRRQGFKEVTSQDGTKPFEGEKVDGIVTNPPFGSSTPREYDGHTISSLEGQMAINALDSMKDDGRAAIIIGGNTEYGQNGAIKGTKDKSLMNYLYDNYNVIDVINIAGELYGRNGTKYPTRMILIAGRRTDKNTVRFAPVFSKARPERVTTFDELYNRVEDDIRRINEQPTQTSASNVRDAGGRQSERQPGNTSGSTERVRPTSVPERESNEEQPRPAGRVGSGDARQDASRPVAETGSNESSQSGGNERTAGEPAQLGGERLAVDEKTSESAPKAQNIQPSEPKKAEKAQLGQEKVAYPRRSRSGEIGSVVPANQSDALTKVFDKFDDIDQYLVEKLGYSDKNELYSHLAAEQIDSVALAIAKMEEGGGFIIGDMTGVGKGRQAAALIRYAVRSGKKPIFFTVKKTLFSDIYRDLVDIGSKDLKPFIFATKGKPKKSDDEEENKKRYNEAAMTDEEGNLVYDIPKDKETERVLKYVEENGTLPPEYDYAVTTYDAVKSGMFDYKNGHSEARDFRGRKVPALAKSGQKKRDFVEKLAKNNFVIMDESHNASGDGGGSGFMQHILPTMKGVTFLSATFAKRPDNMPLYAMKTAMSKAGIEANKLIEAIKRGGTTLQEIMSRMLTEAGEMIRRERDFTGVTIDWLGKDPDVDKEEIEKQEKQFDALSEIFSDIVDFQTNYVQVTVDAISDELAEMQADADFKKGTKFAKNSAPFASKMYNLTQQLLFSLKVNDVVNRVISDIKAGLKPVIAVNNTMEGFIDDMPLNRDMEEPDLSSTMIEGLDGCLRITENHGETKVQRTLSLSELTPEAQRRYKEIAEKISKLSTGLTISPIDAIKNKLKAAGYSVGELTGRKSELRANADGTVRKVERMDTDKKKIARDFNNGKIDIVILNRSASTGISLHSSTKFKDQRQRVMVFAQQQADINEEVQMRGRIDRTGQVHRAKYEYIVSNIPAEQRLLMMFKAKLKSLDANTTASQKSKFNEMETVDVLNKYGDDIVAEYMAEHPEIYDRLADPLKWNSGGPSITRGEEEEDRPNANAATKVLGKLTLLPVKLQQQVLDEITERYKTRIAILDEAGENDLVITELPLKAKTVKKSILKEGVEPGTSFGDNTYLEKVEVDVLKKPMKAVEVKSLVEQTLDGKTADEYVSDLKAQVEEKRRTRVSALSERRKETIENGRKRIEEKTRSNAEKTRSKGGVVTEEQIQTSIRVQMDNIKEKANDTYKRQKETLDNSLENFETALDGLKPGMTVVLPEDMQNPQFGGLSPHFGMFIGFKFNKDLTPSGSTAIFAALDGRRRITVPINNTEAIKAIISRTNAYERETRVVNLNTWDRMIPTATRKNAYIITGNILQGLVSSSDVHGKLVSYTTDTGEVKQGVLMGESFEPRMLSTEKSITTKLDAIRSGETIESSDHDITIGKPRRFADYYELRVPLSKQRGGKYFLDRGLRNLVDDGEFEGSGTSMRGVVREENLEKVLNYLSKNFGTKVTDEFEEVDDSGTRLREVEEYTEEEQRIIDDAKKNGTYMKAPNGKRTKLSEKQWVRVRTKAFKKWFGDWENEDAVEDGEVSVMRNTDGSPKIYYHHTDAEFTAFNPNKNGQNDAGWLGDGFYFYGSPYEGVGYGSKSMQVYLNIRNPYYITTEEHDELVEANNRDKSIEFTNRLKEEGYDGVYWNGDLRDEVVAFYPNQVKSADPVTYDDAGNVIPLSERFNRSKDDIRFREGSAPANSQPAEKMKEHLTKLAKKIGVKAVFHDDASTITNTKVKEALQKGRFVAGWYDPKDNSVHFYMPNIKDRYEAEKTIWHEVVGHKGMRALLGEEGYRTFMRRLWMDKSEDFEEMHQWVVENYMRYGGNLYETIDEWFAYNVVEPSIPKTMWDKVMQVLSDVLRKLGFMTTPNMKDMKYMLWLSRNAIKEGDAWTELQRNATLAKLDLESRRRVSAYGKDAARARDGFANTPTGDTEREMYRNGLMRKMFAWTEAHQDYMASAKLLMDAILKGRSVLDKFNFYWLENHSDPKIMTAEILYKRDYCEPMDAAIGRCVAAIGGKLSEAYEVLEDYMAMKHGLERNREFFVRDWMEEKRKKTPTIDDLDEEAKSEYESAAIGIEQGFEDGTIETEEERDKELKKALEDSYSSMLDRIEEGWAAAKAQPTNNLAEWLKGLDDYIRQNIDDKYEAGKHDYSGLTSFNDNVNPNLEDGYDYDDDAVIGYVADMESKIGVENVAELWEQKGRMTQFALDIEHEAGLITDRNYDKVSQMFHWYMPLRKWDEDMAEDIWSYMNSKKNTYVGRTLMKAGGRKSRAAMPIGTMFAMGGNAISRAARNEVKKAFAGFIRMYERPAANDNDPLVTELEAWVENLGTEENPDWVYSFPDIPENATADEVREAKNAWAQHMLELMQEGRAMRVRQGDTIPYRFESKKRSRPEHIVEVYEEGQPHFFIVNDNPRAAQAINGQLKPETKHKNTAIANRLLSSLATSYSPTFVVRNAFRDAEYALNILLVKEGRNYAGRYVKNYAKLMLNGNQKDSVPLIYTLFRKFREGTLDESNEMERYFKEFAENGGITGYVMENNAERWEKEILAGVKEIGQNKAVRVTKNIGNLIKEGLDRYGEGVENAARFATYMTSRQGAKNKNGRTYSEMPRSIIRSIHDAKEVSVNFNRKGAGYKTESLLNEKGEKTTNAVAAAKTAQYMRANTLFYNAGLQGVMNSLTNAKKKPWWFAAKFAVPAMTLGMVMALANYGLALLLDDDDDRKKYGTDPYADLPEYTRRQNVCIYLGHGKFVMIPLSIEHRALYGIGDILAGEGAVDGFTDYKGENLKSVDHPLGLDILRQLTAFSPVDYNSKETGIEGVTGWGVGILIPAYVSPLVNAYNNTRWTGTPIQNESKFDNGTTPEYQLAKDYTNDLMVSGSKWWHELWGGNEVQRAGRAEGNKFSKAVGSIIGDKAVEFIGEISPAKMEYVIEQYSGETVKGGAGVKNLFEMMFGDKKMDLRKVPIAKAFLTTPNDNTLYRRANTKYWKYVDEFRKVEQENRDYRKKVESEEGKTKDLYEKYFNRFKESKRYRQWRIYHPAKGQGTRNYKKEIDGWTDKIKNESDPIQKSGYTMDRNLVIYELVEQLEGTE